jgi:hypothetical protein
MTLLENASSVVLSDTEERANSAADNESDEVNEEGVRVRVHEVFI